MKCKYCNSEIEGNERFCPYCGKEVVHGKRCEPRVSGRNSKTWLWILGAILLLGIVVGCYLFIGSDKDTSMIGDNPIDVESKSLPSVQRLGALYNDMYEGKLSALKDDGFILVDKQTKKETSDYEEDEEYEITKEVYVLHYSFFNANNSTNVQKEMTATYVYSPSYGDPRMIIDCDTETWNEMKASSISTLKQFVDNSYFLDNSSFISFNKKGVIEITTENSITW